MLVYLDNAQLAWLERLPAPRQHAFAEELSVAGAEVVLSPLHLQEVGQLDDVDKRLDVLRALEPTWLAHSTYSLLLLEIRLSLLRLTEHQGVEASVPVQHILLPLDLDEIVDTVVAQKPAFDAMRAALQLGAEAEALTKNLPPTPRTTSPPTPAQMAESLELARSMIFVQLPEGSSIRTAIEAALPSIGQLYLDGLKPREVLRHALGVADMTKSEQAPLADLSNISVLRVLALEVCAAEHLGDCADIVAHFDPYDCPSFRAKAAVRRARVSHPKLPEPGDQIDEDHLAYAPYMDLMFVDKRTRSFAEQEARRSHGLLRPTDVAALAQAKDLGDILALVKSSSERKAGAS